MKIVYVGTRLQVNGATNVAVEQCNLLQSMGHRVRMAVLGRDSLDWCNPLVPVKYLTSLRGMPIYDDELIVALDSFITNWFVRQYGEKRVVSLIQVDEPGLYNDPKLITAAKAGFSQLNPKITVSKYLHDVLLSYGMESFVIAPAISGEIFYPAERTIPESNKPFRVLVVGSYDHPLKKVSTAFSALEKLKQSGIDVRLNRLVRKPENYAPKGVETTWFIDLPQERIGEVYRSSDALLSASISEGFGLILLEAMACGVPFITTDNGGSRDIVSLGTDMVVEVGDIDAMAGSLHRLATDPRLWSKLRDIGLERVKNWSWEKSAAGLEAQLKSIYCDAFL